MRGGGKKRLPFPARDDKMVAETRSREDVIVTPHNSFNGDGNPQRLFACIYRDIKLWLEKENRS